MRQQIVFRQYNPNKPHRYDLLLNDARFPYTYKAVQYAAKPKAGDGPYYLKSNIDYIKYLVTKVEADQPNTGRTFSTDCLYTSIESTNRLLDCGIATVGTLQEGRSGIPYKLFDTQNRDIFSTTCNFEKEKKNICLTSYTVKTKPKGKKNVNVLSTSIPWRGKAIDDSKEKPKLIKFNHFTEGGTDIVDQLNDYCTTRSNFYRWVMLALSYMLDTARVNGKTVWCLKNNSDISSTSSYDFSWILTKVLALPHVQQRRLNGLASSVQLKIKMFLGTVLLVDEAVPKKREDSQEPDKGEDVNYTWPIATQRQKRTMPQNQLNSANHVVSVFAENICELAMVAYNEILFYISYSQCLTFRLCSSMIVFYTSLEVIKLAFLENSSRDVCCIFVNFIFTFE